jgi:cell surface protein SprA
MIRTAFEPYDPVQFSSHAYENFLYNRKIIADRLAEHRQQIDPNYSPQMILDTITGEYYPQGYSFYSQQVLIPSLLAAYTGWDPKTIELSEFPTIPLPDWRVSFDGLSNLPFIKKFVNKFTINHSYASTYTVNNFQSNPNFDFDTYENYGYSDVTYSTTGDFIPLYEISAVSLSERFVPFIGLDVQFKNKMSIRLDYKRTRDIYLSFSNNQIRERHSNSLTFGSGYIIPNVRFAINTPSGPQTIKSDLNLRVDLTYEHTYEIYRRIIEGISQLNIERSNLILSITGDYNINDKVSIQLYYNHNVMETNTAPKTLNIEGGFRVRVALTQ